MKGENEADLMKTPTRPASRNMAGKSRCSVQARHSPEPKDRLDSAFLLLHQPLIPFLEGHNNAFPATAGILSLHKSLDILSSEIDRCQGR